MVITGLCRFALVLFINCMSDNIDGFGRHAVYGIGVPAIVAAIGYLLSMISLCNRNMGAIRGVSLQLSAIVVGKH